MGPAAAMRTRLIVGLSFAIAAGALAIAVWLLVRPQATEPAPEAVPQGGSLEGVRFDDFGESGATSLEALSDRALVVNFFATWCAPCVKEMPEFQAVYEEAGAKVQFLGVNLRDDAEGAKTLVKRTGVTYLVASDPQGEMFQRMGGFGMPTTFFIAPGPKLLERRTGPLSAEQLRERLMKHFSIEL